MKQFVVIGAGRFGREVATSLSAEGCQVMLLDSDDTLVQQMSERVTQAIRVNVCDDQALESLDLGDMDVAVVAIGSKLEASILATMKLKELGIKTVVSKAGSAAHSKILSRVGADKVIFPEKDMAVRLARSLVSSTISDIIELSEDHSIIEIKAPDYLIGQSLAQADVRSRFGVDIVAFKRMVPRLDQDGETELKEEVVVAPKATEIFRPNDTLVVLGYKKNLARFEKS